MRASSRCAAAPPSAPAQHARKARASPRRTRAYALVSHSPPSYFLSPCLHAQAERRGVAPKKGKGAKGAKRAAADEHSDAERKELQKMMMAKKDARLYKQMQFGIARKQAAADKLSAKRARLESPAKAKGKAKGVEGKGDAKRARK